MTQTPRSLSSDKRWLILFGLWIALLSGVFSGFVGSPGVLQAIRLKNLLEIKKEQLAHVQEDVKKLQFESTQLEHSKVAQEREVRKVLGYAANDEIIFDFTSNDQY